LFEEEWHMENARIFDYEHATCDTLAGIYVEASDETAEQASGVASRRADPLTPQPVALFGLTVTADDSATVEQATGQPTTH
jgi:hypothetical protein